MTIFQAIILGIVQGFTEFLPISSSAHLFLVPYIFGWNYQGLGFDVALHWGTLLSVIVIFGKDYWRYAKALLMSVAPAGETPPNPSPLLRPLRLVGDEASESEAGPLLSGGSDASMALYLVLGSIPAAFVGFFLRSQAETVFRNPWIIVGTLAGFAVLLWVADKLQTTNHKLQATKLTWKKVLFIGVAQALAIVPGVSRSGVTITAGLFSKLSRQEAVKFSFLLLGPISFGAGLVTIPNLDNFGAPLIAGFIASAVSGFIAIKFLLRYVGSYNFNLFVWYRILFAGIIVLSLLTR